VLTLALVVFDGAVLWLLLLIHPNYPEAAVIVGLIGLHGAGMVPVYNAALTDVFGQVNFSRAYGLVQLIILPFSVLCVPVTAALYAHTGSFNGVFIGMAAFLGLGAATAFSVRWSWRQGLPALAE
jgi:hypothetical protein